MEKSLCKGTGFYSYKEPQAMLVGESSTSVEQKKMAVLTKGISNNKEERESIFIARLK